MTCRNCFNLVQKEDFAEGGSYDWCVVKHDNPDVDMERECLFYKPKTNYDRIISKTPEELAVWLAQQEYRRPRFDGWLPLCNHVMGAKACHAHGCEACWLDWLRKEAGE